jgi:hypothetical protein
MVYVGAEAWALLRMCRVSREKRKEEGDTRLESMMKKMMKKTGEGMISK